MKAETVELDVRDLLDEGRSPLPLIVNTAGSLKPEQSLRLITAWEPTPLYDVLGRLGFSHSATQENDGRWIVDFRRSSPSQQEGRCEPPCIF